MMKKILTLMLVLVLALGCFASCGEEKPEEKTYTLAMAVENTVEGGKVTNYVVALVLDGDNKIVASRIDCVEGTATITDGAIADVADIASKVEQGDSYPMTSGSYAQQTKAFEDAIVGKTADEVAALDMTLVTGCTMPYSPYSFKTVIASSFANAR